MNARNSLCRIASTDLPLLELFPFERSHAELVACWIADAKARVWLDLGGGRQNLSTRELYLMLTSSRIHARLFRAPGGTEPLGLVCLNDANNAMGSAEVWGVRGFYTGGPPNMSLAAFLLVLANGFLDLGRTVIGSWVVEGNEFSVAMHLRLGLKQTGRQRLRHQMNGRHYDRLLFDITRDEFFAAFPDAPAESGRTARTLAATVGAEAAHV